VKPLAVILAGGFGKRLGALAKDIPKPMVPVGGVPFLDHILRQLAGQGFEEVLLLVGYRAEVILARYGNGAAFGLKIAYSRETEPLGTGGAFRLARPLITRKFLMLYGDLYRPVNYSAVADAHLGNCLAVYPHVAGLTTIACANIGLDSTRERISIYAKDRPDLDLTHVDAGFGIFGPEVLDLLPEGVSNFEECIYPTFASRNLLEAELVDRNFFDIGNPADLAHTLASLPSTLEDTP
jgi:D-glycero-D-manno-heptose 1,7-bisphosphate phosphatase